MRILIGADVVPTPYTEELFVKQDFKTLFGDIADRIRSADRTVINLECALTESETRIKKFGPCLKANPKCADALKALGVTDIMLANNHMFDFGVKGMVDTLSNLERVGLPYTGCGENDTLSRKPHIVEQDGKKIGFINVCEHEYSYALPDRMGANPFDPFLTMQDIRNLKKQVDFVIVLYHGAKEHCRYPSPRMINLTHEMVHCGADVVITQHSHCIGCYEEYENGHILHGQGNFHFCCGDDKPETWYTSLLVELKIDKEVQIKFYPIVTKERGIEIAKGQKGEEIMSAFASRNEEVKNGKWIDGWRAFCESVSEGYKGVLNGLETPETIERKTQRFAHYLDCEAHTDVWRELYPTWNHTNEK
ncbi:MAG: CapA family protein [Clostridia bacterium]|nr:CapA family protein [Clostridia bacterium]